MLGHDYICHAREYIYVYMYMDNAKEYSMNSQ